jgi:hypothetical protein
VLSKASIAVPCLQVAHRPITDRVVLSSKTADCQLQAQHSSTTTMVKKSKSGHLNDPFVYRTDGCSSSSQNYNLEATL